ncbi:MAG: response regulator transcription factor, partial [Chloroflexota bacterium]
MTERCQVMKIRVIVADRNNLVCEALCAMLKDFEHIEVVGAATDCQAMIELVKTASPSVLMMDMAISPLDTDDTIRQIRKANSDVKVLLVNEYEDKEDILRGLKDGCDGYLPKRAKSTELMTALTALSQGGYFLYPSVAKKLVGEYLSLGQKQKPGCR